MKKIVIYFVLLTTFALFFVSWNASYAGIFGNINSYDECILENMKGVKSDLAVKQIIKSCKNKYRIVYGQELSIEKIKNIKIFDTEVVKNNFTCNIYNRNKNIVIKKIILKISTSDAPTKSDLFFAELYAKDPSLEGYGAIKNRRFTNEELEEFRSNPQKRKNATITNEYAVGINLKPLETSQLKFIIIIDQFSLLENIEIVRAYGIPQQ
jgi:hypothetical protein